MTDLLPNEIAAAFQRHELDSRHAVWFLVDADGRLLERGGDNPRLGIPVLEPGCDARRASDVLDALLEPQAAYEVLPRVEVAPGIAVDVHRGRLGSGGSFLLLFDVSEDASSETQLRQRGLDLGRLLRGLGSESFQRTRAGAGWEEALAATELSGPRRLERVSSIRVRVVEERRRRR